METISNIYEQIKNILYNNNYIETQLYNRLKNNNELYFNMPSKDLQTIYLLDEFIYKIIDANEISKFKEPFNQYIKTISNQLETNPLLLLSLPIWKLDKIKLRRYLPNYDNIMIKINQLQSEANMIFRKFETSPDKVTKNEIIKMIKFFSYTIPYANEKMLRAQEIVAKYLLNNGQENDDYYNYEVAIFLIKFFGYEKIKEEGLEDTKIIIGNLSLTTRGESSQNFAIINKQLLQKIIIKNNTLTDKFGRQIISRNHHKSSQETYNEILGILHTMYHEIRHQKQKNHSMKHKIDDLSYYYTAYEIINETDETDYRKNYKCYEIEKDANYKAWEDIEKLIKKYMPKNNIERLMRNILSHKIKEELEQITGIRKTNNNQPYISNDLLIKLLDSKIRENTYYTLKNYPQLLNFYKHNGTPKRVIELLKQPLIYNYKEFYYGQISYRSKIFGYQLTIEDLKYQQPTELQTIINNIKILMDITREKLNKICDREKKYKESIEELNKNVINYYEFATSLSNTINQILYLYPKITSNLLIKNSITSINDSIDMINKNSLVIKIINNRSKISRVGRR